MDADRAQADLVLASANLAKAETDLLDAKRVDNQRQVWKTALAAATLNNKRISNSLGPVMQGVKRGEGIAGPIRREGAFPPLAAHLLSVGEETGHLDVMFSRMADIYEKDTRTAIRRFTSLFEPIVILVLGVMVGALILSMMLAITSINEVAI